jgi:hypothetical protein
MQVVVTAEQLEVEYRFGMSEATMRSLLTARQLDPSADLLQLEQQLLSALSAPLTGQIDVTLAGQPLAPKTVAAELIYLHHTQFACRFGYAWPANNPQGELVIADRSFPDFPGHAHVAIKARDATPLQTAEPPILVRSPRQPVLQNLQGQFRGPTILAQIGAPAADDSPRPSQGHAADPPSTLPAPPPTANQIPPSPTAPTRTLSPTMWSLLAGIILLATVPWLFLSGKREVRP